MSRLLLNKRPHIHSTVLWSIGTVATTSVIPIDTHYDNNVPDWKPLVNQCIAMQLQAKEGKVCF